MVLIPKTAPLFGKIWENLAIAVMVRCHEPARPTIESCFSGVKELSDTVISNIPAWRAAIILSSFAKIPFVCNRTVNPFVQKALIISGRSLRKNGSPPVKRMIPAPSLLKTTDIFSISDNDNSRSFFLDKEEAQAPQLRLQCLVMAN